MDGLHSGQIALHTRCLHEAEGERLMIMWSDQRTEAKLLQLSIVSRHFQGDALQHLAEHRSVCFAESIALCHYEVLGIRSTHYSDDSMTMRDSHSSSVSIRPSITGRFPGYRWLSSRSMAVEPSDDDLEYMANPWEKMWFSRAALFGLGMRGLSLKYLQDCGREPHLHGNIANSHLDGGLPGASDQSARDQGSPAAEFYCHAPCHPGSSTSRRCRICEPPLTAPQIHNTIPVSMHETTEPYCPQADRHAAWVPGTITFSSDSLSVRARLLGSGFWIAEQYSGKQ
nr:hypothetical protein CFP56_41495 [Quercus suber]